MATAAACGGWIMQRPPPDGKHGQSVASIRGDYRMGAAIGLAEPLATPLHRTDGAVGQGPTILGVQCLPLAQLLSGPVARLGLRQQEKGDA